MSEELVSGLAAKDALLELGVVLGQNHAFGVVAGRCSAAQAEAIRPLREENLYKRCCEKRDDFCPKYLKISWREADRTIKILDQFGSAYFELSQLTRVLPETYRAIAPAIEDGLLHFKGEAIPLNADNSREVAAAIAELRSALPKKSPEELSLMCQVDQIMEEGNLGRNCSKWRNAGWPLLRSSKKSPITRA